MLQSLCLTLGHSQRSLKNTALRILIKLVSLIQILHTFKCNKVSREINSKYDKSNAINHQQNLLYKYW